MKNIFKSRLFIFIITAIVFTGVGVYAATINSSDVSYTPSDSNWNVSNVADAIDELYTMKGNTPNDVRNWLKIGNVNKDYTSITQVLSDTDTLQALMNSDRACSYLKSSTEWINLVTSSENAMTYIGANDACADILFNDNDWADNLAGSQYWDKVLKPLVPTMTSNTLPRGVASASSTYMYNPYNVFDGTASHATAWTANSTTNEWIQYEFINEFKVYKFKIISNCGGGANAQGMKNYKIQASNDGFVNDSHDLFAGLNNNTGVYNTIIENLNNPSTYKYYRCFVSDTWGIHVSINALQFYGR